MYPTPNSAVKWLGSLTNVLNSWRTENRICAQPITVFRFWNELCLMWNVARH